MDWKQSVRISLALAMMMTSQAVTADQCLKSFPAGTPPPDDQLMKAFYYSDPDPDTGYIKAVHQVSADLLPQSVTLTNVVVDYNTWLAKTHNATELIANFWLYLNGLIVSDIRELYQHYRISHLLGPDPPLGTFNFFHLQDLFSTACGNYASVQDTWPYNCLERDLFCAFNSSLAKLQYMISRDLSFSDTDFQVNQALSELAVDDHYRATAMEFLFNPNVLRYIPAEIQDSVMYRSKLVERALLLLAADAFVSQWPSVDTLLSSYIESKCQEYGVKPIAKIYFCKANEFLTKMRACLQSANHQACLYDEILQDFFTTGTLGRYSDMIVINRVRDKTQDNIKEIKNVLRAQNRNGLEKLYNKYLPSVTVPDSMCTQDWPNGFDCTKQAYCLGSPETYFDCKGSFDCRLDMMYRFDCLMKFVLNKTKGVLDATAGNIWTSTQAKKVKYDTLVWLSFLPFARYSGFSAKQQEEVIISTQSQIKDFLNSYDYQGLGNFLSTLPAVTFTPQWVIDAACKVLDVAKEHVAFCNIEPLLSSAFLLVNSINRDQQATTKVLQPDIDYPRLLEQLQLERISNTINVQTERAVTYLSSKIKTAATEVHSLVSNNAASLSDYFSSIANYDKTKADSDIAYIDARLALFKFKITDVSAKVIEMFNVILGFAIGANTAEMANRAVEMGVAIVQVANPFSTLFGGSSILDLMGSIDDLAQAGVTSAIIGQISSQAFPDLIARAKVLGTGFLQNEQQLKDAKQLIDELKTGVDAASSAKVFLGKYNDYDPKVLSSDIAIYGEKWQTVAGQLCDAAFDGGTAASALGEVGLASKGDCTNIGSKIEELIDLYEEFYDYQFDVMDALSDAARSYLAYQKANDMKLAYSSVHNVDDQFVNKFAVNTLLVSLLNIWSIVTEYCNVLSYTRGGAIPDQCIRALQSPNPNTVAQVISYRPSPSCNINNEITKYMKIPVHPASSNDTAYVDLDLLYDQQDVSFKIPSFQWLKDNEWVGLQDAEKAMYVKRFEVFLPPMSGTEEHTVQVEVDPSLANILREGGTKYLLPVTGYSSRYTENSFNCFNTPTRNPYDLCESPDFVKLCITSNGYVDRSLQPSIYNEWKIQATSLPPNQTPPNPVTDFKLQAAVTMCMVDLPPTVRKRSVWNLGEMTKRKRAAQHCCTLGQYWSGTACQICPVGSTAKLNGYYCE